MVDKFAWKIAVGAVVLITAKILFSLIHEEPTFSDPSLPNYSLSTNGIYLPCYCSVGENTNYLQGIEGTKTPSSIVTYITKVPSSGEAKQSKNLNAYQCIDYSEASKVGPWLTAKGFVDKLSVQYKGKEFSMTSPQISTIYWNEAKKSLHFLANGAVWKWTERDGFRKLTSSIKNFQFGSFSSDGNYFAVNKGDSNLSVYSATKYIAESIPEGYQYYGMLSLGKYLLVKGIEKEGYLWQPAMDTIRALKFEGVLCNPISFNGSIWGIHKAGRAREAVRLDSSFDKIVQRISLP